MSKPGAGKEEKRTVITSVNSERAACQVSSAAPSACQSSLGVVNVAKLCHVYTRRNTYICHERRGGEQHEMLDFSLVSCFFILVTDKTRGIKCLSVIVHSIPRWRR